MVKLFSPLWPHSPVEIPSPFGTLTPDNPLSGADGPVRGLNQLFQLSRINPSAARAAIIKGEKPESTYHGLKDNISED